MRTQIVHTIFFTTTLATVLRRVNAPTFKPAKAPVDWRSQKMLEELQNCRNKQCSKFVRLAPCHPAHAQRLKIV